MSDNDGLRIASEAMLQRALSASGQNFGSFFLSRFLGFEVSYEGERCIVSFEAAPPLFNPQGSLHDGILDGCLHGAPPQSR